MSAYFHTCESCDKVAKRVCNCLSSPRFLCDDHTLEHLNSDGDHLTKICLMPLLDEEISVLKQTVQTYQTEVVRQAISIKNKIIDSLFQKIRRVEQECSSFIENTLNGEIKDAVEQLASVKSLPVFSSSSFLSTLVSLKRAQTFSPPEILKELLSASSSSLSSLELIFSTKTASSQACPSFTSTSSQLSYSPDLSTVTLSSFLISPKVISLSSSSSQTFSSFCLSNLPINTLSGTNIFAKAKENDSTNLRAIEKQKEIAINLVPRWELSHQIDAHTGNSYYGSANNRQITCIAVSDCNRYFASTSYDETIKIWDARSSKLLRSLKGHTKRVTSVSFLGNKIVSGSEDKKIKIWEEERCIKTLSHHSKSVLCLCVSTSKRLIASGGSGKKVIVFDIESDRSLHTLESHSDWVRSVLFSSDDREIISGSDDKSIKVWKTETGELLKTLNRHDNYVVCVRISGKFIVSSSRDKNIKVGQRDREESLICLRGHTHEITSVDIFNNAVVSISNDNSIRIWDFESGKQIQTLEGHGSCQMSNGNSRVGSLKIIEEGRYIVSGGADGRIKVWRRTN